MSTLRSPSHSAEDRLQRIKTVTDSTLAHLDADALFVELLDRVREILQADTAAVLLLRESTRELVTMAVRGLEEGMQEHLAIPVGEDFVGRIATEKQAIAIDDVSRSPLGGTVLEHMGIRSVLGVPLLADRGVLGVLYVGTRRPRHFTGEDIELLQVAGDRFALALRARSVTNERNAGMALQRSLVPERLPDIPGLAMASRYLPAEDGGVGGDWYDIFTLPSGHVCITVGDVAGRGLRAAVVMGRLRSTVRAYAMEVTEPAELLTRVDRKLQHFEPAEMATVLFGVFDPSLQRMRIALAGHPAPVLAVPGQAPHFVDLPIDPPLGVSRVRARRSSTIEIPHGALLCFFTDGLVERRTIPLGDRLGQLVESVTPEAPDDVCRRVMARLVQSDATGDDIALLAIRRLEPSEIKTLDVEVPAVPASLGRIRVAMRRWLAVVDAAPEDVTDILTATGEACSNVVEHAYGARRGTMSVRMEHDPANGVVVTVSDTGRWRAPRGGNRGRGLRLMELCSDQVDIRDGPSGTQVVIHRRLSRPVPETRPA